MPVARRKLPQLTKQLFALAKARFSDAWDMRLTQAHQEKDEIAKQLRDTEKQIETLLERIVEADNPIVVKA